MASYMLRLGEFPPGGSGRLVDIFRCEANGLQGCLVLGLGT